MSPEEKKRWTVKALLSHVLEAASAVETYSRGRTLEDFHHDRMFRHAVEREFTIIGEAMTRLRRDFPQVSSRITEDQRIIAFRNQLVHGYDIINDSMTWDIVQHKVPILRSEVESLLNEMPDDRSTAGFLRL